MWGAGRGGGGRTDYPVARTQNEGKYNKAAEALTRLTDSAGRIIIT